MARSRDIRQLRKQKRSPWTKQTREDKQAGMDKAFEQLAREREQKGQQ